MDYRELGRDLDVLSYDSYPFFEHDPERRAVRHAFNLDRTRAWTGNFLVMEQQSGPGGSSGQIHDTPEPGEMRRMAYSSIAHGADGIFFFRWRTCRFGQEEYWCGILDHDNVPRRRYAEAVQLGAELRRIGPQVCGTSVTVEAAIASSDNDVNNGDEAYSLGLPGPTKMAEPAHEWLFRRGYAVGCVHPADDLSGVSLFIIPHWPLFDATWARNLEEFVSRGGTLVIGARTATRDLNNNVVGETLPGVLRALAGVRVEEYGRRNAPEKRPIFLQVDTSQVPCDVWYEALLPDADVEVLGRWQGRHLTGEAGITARRLGSGQVIYVGSYLTAELVATLMPVLVARSGLKPLLPSVPAGLEIVRRENAGRRLWFLINHTDAELQIDALPHGINLLSGARVESLLLPANDVAIVCQSQHDESP
jgi:beta-galactosidase